MFYGIAAKLCTYKGELQSAPEQHSVIAKKVSVILSSVTSLLHKCLNFMYTTNIMLA